MATAACILCASPQTTVIEVQGRFETYFHCADCDLRFLNPSQRLAEAEEKARYLSHNNDVTDIRYRNFVKPLFDAVVKEIQPGAVGMDFGAGTGPMIAKMLDEAGFRTALYDPFFWPDREPLSKKYDFIVASEVLEHLFDPRTELSLIKDLLRPAGVFAFMTQFFNESIDFADWYYRRDPTHVAFYSVRTLKWIRLELGFSALHIVNDRIGVLKN